MAGYEKRFAGLPRQELEGGLVIVRADTLWVRGIGLARLPALAQEIGLLIPRCRSIHTFGVRFPIDLLWITADHTVARIDYGVAPRRTRSCRQAHSVLETLAGSGEAFLAAVTSQRILS